MKIDKIIFVTFLFATLFFGKSFVLTAVPSIAENFAVKENAGAKCFKSALEEQQAKNYEKAVELYNKAISADSTDNESCSYNAIGKIYEEEDNFDKATQNYLKAIELYPEDIDAYYNLGEAFKNHFSKTKVS